MIRKNPADKMLMLYFFCNVSYSLGLKNILLADMSLLAMGYVLRVLYGGMLAGIEISNWMYLAVLCGSCYLGFAKRRQESHAFGDESREVLGKYTYEFLDNTTQLFMCMTLIFYSLWCVDRQTVIAGRGNNFIWSIPVVFLILLRYNWQLGNETCDGDPVEIVLRDKIILTMAAIYAIMAGKALYL